MDRPFRIVQVERLLCGQQLHAGLPVRIDSANIPPVEILAYFFLNVVRGDPVPAVDHPGNDVMAEIAGAVLVTGIRFQSVDQYPGIEDVDSH